MQFTGQFDKAESVVFNGVTYSIGPGLNPAFELLGADKTGIQGIPNQLNTYVLTWRDSVGNVKFNTVMYVTLKGLTGVNPEIDEDPTKTFLFNNEYLPNFQPKPVNWKVNLSVFP